MLWLVVSYGAKPPANICEMEAEIIIDKNKWIL